MYDLAAPDGSDATPLQPVPFPAMLEVCTASETILARQARREEPAYLDLQGMPGDMPLMREAMRRAHRCIECGSQSELCDREQGAAPLP